MGIIWRGLRMDSKKIRWSNSAKKMAKKLKMENKKIIHYANSINEIVESDLIIDNFDLKNNISFKYVLLTEKARERYYVPIKVKIKYEIENAKVTINEIHSIKEELIPTIKKHIKRLKIMIKLSEEHENFFSQIDKGEVNELFNAINVKDGYSNARSMAISSYKIQLLYADKILKKSKKNYKTMKKNNLVSCRDKISKLLKDNGIKSHRIDAQNLMNWNGLDTPSSL